MIKFNPTGKETDNYGFELVIADTNVTGYQKIVGDVKIHLFYFFKEKLWGVIHGTGYNCKRTVIKTEEDLKKIHLELTGINLES